MKSMRHLGYVSDLRVSYLYLIFDFIYWNIRNENTEKSRRETFSNVSCMLMLLLLLLGTETERKCEGCPKHLHQLNLSANSIAMEKY